MHLVGATEFPDSLKKQHFDATNESVEFCGVKRVRIELQGEDEGNELRDVAEDSSQPTSSAASSQDAAPADILAPTSPSSQSLGPGANAIQVAASEAAAVPATMPSPKRGTKRLRSSTGGQVTIHSDQAYDSDNSQSVRRSQRIKTKPPDKVMTPARKQPSRSKGKKVEKDLVATEREKDVHEVGVKNKGKRKRAGKEQSKKGDEAESENVWSVEALLENRDSVVGEVSYQDLFNGDVLLTHFTPAERAELLDLLPKGDQEGLGRLLCPSSSSSSSSPSSDIPTTTTDPQSSTLPTADPQALDTTNEEEQINELDESVQKTKLDTWFRIHYDLKENFQEYQEDLMDGMYEPKTQARLIRNMDIIAMQYDAFKDEQFEEVWGDLIEAEAPKNSAAKPADFSLPELVMGKQILVGDALVYRRTFAHFCTVEKRLDITSINGAGQLTVRYPIDSEGDDEEPYELVLENVTAPMQLERWILDLDGRVPKESRPNGNAWKSISLVRGGQDPRTLFVVRSGFFDRTLGLQAADALQVRAEQKRNAKPRKGAKKKK
ncbi:hypothetical protein HK102_006457 [Quaeritorhiza haematococci]|nr:hypothetical protein HK102_006457 [Quaeritorhiza haematococci]